MLPRAAVRPRLRAIAEGYSDNPDANPAVNRTPAGVAGFGARFVGAGYLTR